MKKIILALALALSTSITAMAGEPNAQIGTYYTIVDQNTFADGGAVDDVSILTVPSEGMYSVHVQTILTPIGLYCKAPICYPSFSYVDIFDKEGELVASTYGTDPIVVPSPLAKQKTMYKNIDVELEKGVYKIVIHGELPRYPTSFFGKFGLQVLPLATEAEHEIKHSKKNTTEKD